MKAIADDGGEAIFLEHDVTSPESWDAAIAETLSRYGGLDILETMPASGSARTSSW